MQLWTRSTTLRFCLLLILSLLVIGGINYQVQQQTTVATAKGRVIAAHMRQVTQADRVLWNLALNDDTLGALLRDKEIELLETHPLGVSESAAYNTCSDASCRRLLFYNFTDGGTVETIYNSATNQFLGTVQDIGNRPNLTGYLVDRVVDIAAADAGVTAVLGDLNKAETAMLPMSTWLSDDDCRQDWCVDLTFHDPTGSGKIFHTIVNLSQDSVARTFYTRGRDNRLYQESAELDPEAPLFSNGCHEQHGWNVCWEMTPDDGLNFYNARFDDELVFTTAKISQVEAYYPSWPGGYRDEIGYASTVPPRFDTRLTENDDTFEVRQLFTEPFDWPNCICCYRYEQVMIFGDDGSFETDFVSHGPGCDELSEYRPFWRINMALDGNDGDEAWYWNEREWTRADEEIDLSLYDNIGIDGVRLVTLDDDITYRWTPERSDPLALDEGRLFLVESEGDVAIETGPADTYDPPRAYTDGQVLTDANSDLTVWYIPILKTIKGGPWWCMPDPEPEVNPCSVGLRVERGEPLAQPTEEELAQFIMAQATPVLEQITPTPNADTATDANGEAVAVIPTLRPTPRPITGQSAEEIILNSGCGSCHIIGQLGEEGKVGPSLSNIGTLAGQRVPGQSAETYLYNSIIYPNIFLAPDCPNSDCLANIMPGTYHLTLSDAQVNVLVDYMLTLNDPEPQIIAANEPEPTRGLTLPTFGGSNTAGGSSADTTLTLLALAAGILLVLILMVILIRLLRNGGAASDNGTDES